jgi:ankyrin repeat protein
MQVIRCLFAVLCLISAAAYSQDSKEDLIAKAFKAIEVNDIATLKILIQDKEVLNATYWGDSSNLLSHAVLNQREEAVRVLLASGIDIERETQGGFTALMDACFKGNRHIFKMLIDKGALLKPSDSLIRMAAIGGNVQIARYLVDHGLPLDVKDSEGQGPLHFALENGHQGMANFLLKHDRRLGGMPNLINSAAHGGNIDLVKLSLKLGQSIDSQDRLGWTPLHIAAFEKNFDLANFLIKKGASPNIPSKQNYETRQHLLFLEGFTPIYVAVLNNDGPIMDLLVKEIGQKRFASEAVWLLYFSWIYGYKDLSRHIISECSDVNTTSEEGWTLLHQAAYLDLDIDLIQMILKKGANLRVKTAKPHRDYRGIEFPAGSAPEDIARIAGTKNLSKALGMRSSYQPG